MVIYQMMVNGSLCSYLRYDVEDLANNKSGFKSYIDGKKQPQTFDVHKEGNSHTNGQDIGRDYAHGHGHLN